MFKVILSALVALSFSSFAFAEDKAPAAPTEPPAMDKPADAGAMEGKKMDHAGGKAKHEKHGKKKKHEGETHP